MTEAVADRLNEETQFLRQARPQGARAVVEPVLPFAAAVALAFLLHRLRGSAEPGAEDRLRLAVARVGDEISERAWRVGRDQTVEKRKQRAWSLLQSAVGAGFTLLARRAATGAWEGLTGLDAPGRR